MLGLTIQCAQCHTHKYDPLTHTDYYRMFAFLNNCDEGADHASTPTQQRASGKRPRALIREIEDELRADESRLAGADGGLGRRRSATISRSGRSFGPQVDASGDQKHYVLDDGSMLAAGYAPTKHTTEVHRRGEAAEDHGRSAGVAERSEPAARRAGPFDLRHCAL